MDRDLSIRRGCLGVGNSESEMNFKNTQRVRLALCWNTSRGRVFIHWMPEEGLKFSEFPIKRSGYSPTQSLLG